MSENKFFVGVRAGGVVIMNPPREPLTKTDALELAAMLVVLSGDYDGKEFAEVLKTVK